MDLQERQKKIDTIIKLMATAALNSGATDGERENANRLLAKLTAEYSIDISELRNSNDKQTVFRHEYVLGSTERKFNPESFLAGKIARIFDCEVIHTINNEGKFPNDSAWHWTMVFIGHENDLAVVVYFFKFARRMMLGMCRQDMRKLQTGKRKLGASFQNDYCVGFATSVGARLDEIYSKREEYIPSDCRDLMVLKKEGVETHIRKMFPNVKYKKVMVQKGNHAAYYHGKQAGSKLNLQRPIENYNQTSQIGG